MADRAPEPSSHDLEVLKGGLPLAVSSARSIDEIAEWLQRHPFVREVKVAVHLLKSHPPQREIVVLVTPGAGSTGMITVRVAEWPAGHFELSAVSMS